MCEPMSKALIYLAGPINGCSDEQAKNWRASAKQMFPNCLDPMRRDYRGREAENVTAIVEGDKSDISRCAVVLVWFERSSVGTAMEVFYAWHSHRLVVVVNKSTAPLSPWLVYHSNHICGSLKEAGAFIRATLGL